MMLEQFGEYQEAMDRISNRFYDWINGHTNDQELCNLVAIEAQVFIDNWQELVRKSTQG